MLDAALYSRRVSFNERLYLAAEQLNPGFCIQIVIDGEGELSQEKLEGAVALAALANPGSRLVLRGLLGWSRWVALGPMPPVRVLPHWQADAPPPLDVERPLPFKHGPTCEVIFAPSFRPRIVFRCFHGIMDARGLLHFAEEVFRALRGEPLIGADCMLNDTEFIKSMVGTRRRAALKNDCPSITASSSSSASPVIWKKVSLDGPTPGLVAKIAVLLARHASRFHQSVTRVMIPVDLRNYKRDMQSSGNMTYPLFIDVSTEQSWHDIQKAILKRLVAKEPMHLDPSEATLPWLPMWMVRVFYYALISVNRRRGRFPFSALVTHLALQGTAELNGGGFLARSLYFLPPQTDFIPLSVAAVSSSDSAEIVVSAPSGLLDEKSLSELCDAIRSGVTAENLR